MFSIDEVKGLALLGQPIPFQKVCKIYCLTLDEIYMTLGMDRYNYYVSLLTMDMNDVNELLQKRDATVPAELDIYDYLMLCVDNDKQFFLDLQQALTTFTKEEIRIAPQNGKIIVGNIIDQKIIDKEKFFDFQQIIAIINKLPVKSRPPANETPMQKKFRLKREERERIKAKGKKGNSGETMTLTQLLVPLCNYYPGITLQNIGSYNFYQIKELLEKAQAKEKYRTELDMLLAGADSKKVKPKYWY